MNKPFITIIQLITGQTETQEYSSTNNADIFCAFSADQYNNNVFKPMMATV